MNPPDPWPQAMDEKLRKWLKAGAGRGRTGLAWPRCRSSKPPRRPSSCRRTRRQRTPTSRALRLGRFRLASEFVLTLLLYALMVWFSLSVVLGFEGAVAPWVAATMSALVLAALRQAGVVQGAASSALGSMVRTGEGGPQGPIEEEPKARWLWQAEL